MPKHQQDPHVTAAVVMAEEMFTRYESTGQILFEVCLRLVKLRNPESTDKDAYIEGLDRLYKHGSAAAYEVCLRIVKHEAGEPDDT